MFDQEFRMLVSRSGFLMDWQKERLMEILDNLDDDEGDGDSGPISLDNALLVVDNVLWRTMGVSLDFLPPMDKVSIERAVREVTC